MSDTVEQSKKLLGLTTVLLIALCAGAYYYRDSFVWVTDRVEPQVVNGFHNIEIGEHLSNVIYKKGKPTESEAGLGWDRKTFQGSDVDFVNNRVVRIEYRCPTSDFDKEKLLGIQCGDSEGAVIKKFGGAIKQICSSQLPDERYFVLERRNVFFTLRQQMVVGLTVTSEDPLNEFNSPLTIDCAKLGIQR